MGLVMRILVAAGVISQSRAVSQNWRCREGCNCAGCEAWRTVTSGEATVEQLGKEAIRCDHRYLAWQDCVVISSRFNPVMSLLWTAVVLLTLV